MKMQDRGYHIGIVEFNDFHHIHILFLIKMLQKYSNVKLYLFISKFASNNLLDISENIFDDISLNVFNEKTNMLLYNQKISKQSKMFDALIVNSLIGGRMNYFSYLFLKPKCKYILIDASNGKPYFAKINGYKWNRIYNYIAYKISYRHLEKADKLIYHSREVIKLLNEYTKKETLFLPFTFFDEQLRPIRQSVEKKLVFTITGGIQEFRKDYNTLFRALEILLESNKEISKSIRIVFLGTIKSRDNKFGIFILERAKIFNRKYGKIIKYYDNLHISESEYRKMLEQSDILLNTINLHYYMNGKDSSGLGESIIYSMPGVYPLGYKIYDELQSSSIMYDSPRTLAKNIAHIVENKAALNKLKENAINNSKKFSIEKYSKILYDFIIS